MRIALFTTDLAGHSGWSTYARDLGKQMANQGHTVMAFVHLKTGVAWCEEHELLPEAHHLLTPWLPFFNTATIRRKLDTFNPDIVHFMAEPYALLINSLKKRRCAYCMTLHGTYAIAPLRAGKIVRWYMARALAYSDHIFTVSRYTPEHLMKMEPDVCEKVHFRRKFSVLKNAIDLTAIPFIEHGSRQTASFISVGAVKDRKGYKETIMAIAAFRKLSTLPFHYDIYGSIEHNPQYVAELRELIARNDLHPYVTLHGSVPDETLAEAFRNADLFLLLSKQTETNFEGFGLVFLEANARGIPVIGPTTGGCPEAIENGKSGYVCDPADAERAAEYIRRILEQGTIKRSDCRAWAGEHNVKKAGEQLLKAYEGLLRH